MSLPPNLTAEEFLKQFFCHLTLDDLKNSSDKTLQGFYDYYISVNRQEVPQRDKSAPKIYIPTARQMSILEVYMAYINREQQATNEVRAQEFVKLLEDVKQTDRETRAMIILSKRKNEPDFDPTTETVESYAKIIADEEQRRGNTSVITMSKKLGLRVLSEAMRLSYVTKEDRNKDMNELETMHKTHQEQANIVAEEATAELKAAGLSMPKKHEDPQFNRRNDLMQCYAFANRRIAKLLETEAGQLLRRIYYFNATSLVPQNIRRLCGTYQFSQPNITTTTILDTEKIAEQYGQKEIVHLPAIQTPQLSPAAVLNTTQRCVVNIVECSPLKYMFQQKNKPTLYIASINQLTPGNLADQGYDSQIEAPLYYATSYSAAIEQITHAYPIPAAHVLYAPFVLFVKRPEYPYDNIDGQASGRIRLLCIGSPFRPTVTQPAADSTTYNEALQLPQTKYTDPNVCIVNLITALCTARSLGYDTIVLDDRGIDDYWLPVHHTVQLVSQAIKATQNMFSSVTLCTTRAKYAALFRAQCQ